MLFTSNVFLFYFLPVILVLYFLTSKVRSVQNIILLIGSLFFYAWGEPIFVLILFASVIINYIGGLLVDKWRENKKYAKPTLVITIIANLGILFVFKYLAFTVRNIDSLMGGGKLTIPSIVLPIGISFFTFQALSYVIDVYWGTAKVEKNPFYLALYVSFFPQLIAGPIVRFNTIAEQIRARKVTWNGFSSGCARFALGFSKKVLLSNNFAIIADHVFEFSEKQSTMVVPVTLAWLGAIAYTLQIFYDFSAYSDMAIGLGLMFGFKFEENFNYPYISKSVGEFWRRWHISLSSWFREYVYFPLGGSKVKNDDLMVRNLFVIWLLTGIWHGAEWTFILWGLLSFVFILLERFVDFEERKIPGFIKHIYLLVIIIISWVLFRATNLENAFAYIKNMFGLNGNGFLSSMAFMFVREYLVYFIAGIIFCIPIGKMAERFIVEDKMPVTSKIINFFYPIVLLFLFVISVTFIVKGSYNPFIYFNF